MFVNPKETDSARGYPLFALSENRQDSPLFMAFEEGPEEHGASGVWASFTLPNTKTNAIYALPKTSSSPSLEIAPS